MIIESYLEPSLLDDFASLKLLLMITNNFRFGVHGRFDFLKPAADDHTHYYNVGVTDTGSNDHSVDIMHDLKGK